MNKCKQCNRDYEAVRATSQYCSSVCRLKSHRETLSQQAVSLETLIGPNVYYWPRAHPERINWGEHMTMDQLKEAGLVANRVPIPGDWDYAGVAVDDWPTPAVLVEAA